MNGSYIHVAYVYLDGINRKEIVVRGNDDINEPHFYIVSIDRNKVFNEICIFKNKYTGNLTDYEKESLNTIVNMDIRTDQFPNNKNIVFNNLKAYWLTMNDYDEDTYDIIKNPPIYT